MEANIREERLLALYNELKSSWERENYIDSCTFEERGIGWWKSSIWRLKGMRGNTDKEICPVCRKEGVTRNRRDRWLEKKLQKYIQRLE
jgi:hypothetical protein